MENIGKIVDGRFSTIKDMDNSVILKYAKIKGLNDFGEYQVVPLFGDPEKIYTMEKDQYIKFVTETDVFNHLNQKKKNYLILVKAMLLTDHDDLSHRIRQWLECICEYDHIKKEDDYKAFKHSSDVCKGMRRVHKRLFRVFDEYTTDFEKLLSNNAEKINKMDPINSVLIIMRENVIMIENKMKELGEFEI